MTGGGGYIPTSGPWIEIYWDSDETGTLLAIRPDAGNTTYFYRALQGGVEVETEGSLMVTAGTTWYVGQAGSNGKYGFRSDDAITFSNRTRAGGWLAA